MDEGGSRNGEFLSEKAQWGRPLWRAPLLGTLEDMLRKTLDMGISLHRGPTGELGGDSLAGTFEKRTVYLGSFLGSEDIKILSLGLLGTLVKGQGSPELISDYETQGPVYEA
jgi:hypothetical protein